MKTIAVIAANGRSGKVFVELALLQGHKVRAGVHGSHAFAAHPNLTTLSCDATNENDVRALLSGSDAAISFIGHGPKSPADVQTNAMKVLAKVMAELGMKRLVSLTGTGVRFAGDTPSLLDRLENIAIGFIDPARIKDGRDHVEVLKSSDLDWTVIRVLKLGNGTHEGSVSLSLTGPAEIVTPRKRVAAAALRVIENNSYLRQAPVITGKEKSE